MGQWIMCVSGRDMLGGSMWICGHVPPGIAVGDVGAEQLARGLSGTPQGPQVAGQGPGPTSVAMMVLQLQTQRQSRLGGGSGCLVPG